MISVSRTDGTTEEFDTSRIANQIMRDAKTAETRISDREIEIICEEVSEKIVLMGLSEVSGPMIRAIVADTLLQNGYDTLYKYVQRIGMSLADYIEYLRGSGKDRHENANQQLGPETTHKWLADRTAKEACMKYLPRKLSKLHNEGKWHIHDMEYFFSRPFCFDCDARYFFYYGLVTDGDGSHTPMARAAQHPEVAVHHLVQALGSNQTCFAGGQGYQNFLTFLSPYMRDLNYDRIKQLMQMFVYEMGQLITSRGSQIVFSSVQLSPGVPKIWRDKPAVYKGKISNIPYGEFEREVRLMFKALMEIFLEGDIYGRPFSFPKPEIMLSKEFFYQGTWDKRLYPESRDGLDVDYIEETDGIESYKELYRLVFELASKFGSPYFDNQLPPYRVSENGISCIQCCAYSFQIDADSDKKFEKRLHFEDGEHFSLGSVQVLSLNLPRAAMEGKRDSLYSEQYYNNTLKELKNLVDSGIELFKIKKQWIDKAILPFAQQTPIDPNNPEKRAPPLVDLEDLPYVFGIVGLNECIKIITGEELHEPEEVWETGLKLILELNQYIKEVSQQQDIELALARTPAESCSQRMAICDCFSTDKYIRNTSREVVKGNLQQAINNHTETGDLPIYYSNGTHCDVSANIDIFEKIQKESPFFSAVDGGNIFHIFMGEGFTDPDGLMDFCLRLASNTDIGYFVVNKDFTQCKDCHAHIPGLHDECEKCGSYNVEFLARITGYVQPVSGWNEAKKEELKNRHRYQIN